MTNPDELKQISEELRRKPPELPLKQPSFVEIAAEAIIKELQDRKWFIDDGDGNIPYHRVATPLVRAILKRWESVGAILVRNDWREHMRSLLGTQVAVTISRDPEPVVVTGQLMSFDESGEVVLREEDGFIRWCWPNLSTEAL